MMAGKCERQTGGEGNRVTTESQQAREEAHKIVKQNKCTNQFKTGDPKQGGTDQSRLRSSRNTSRSVHPPPPTTIQEAQAEDHLGRRVGTNRDL